MRLKVFYTWVTAGFVPAEEQSERKKEKFTE
jgi:hypothetical protein